MAGEFKIKIVSFTMRYDLLTLITASLASEHKRQCIREVIDGLERRRILEILRDLRDRNQNEG